MPIRRGTSRHTRCSPLTRCWSFCARRTEWSLEELTASLAELEHGRSFENAKQIFTVANCVGCHKLNGVGNELGPDLSQLDPEKFKPADIVRDVLEPSWRINEKFQSWVFATDSGDVITGMVLEETDDAVTSDREPTGEDAAEDAEEERDCGSKKIGDVDHAEGTAGSAAAERGSGSDGICDLTRGCQGGGVRAASALGHEKVDL